MFFAVLFVGSAFIMLKFSCLLYDVIYYIFFKTRYLRGCRRDYLKSLNKSIYFVL